MNRERITRDRVGRAVTLGVLLIIAVTRPASAADRPSPTGHAAEPLSAWQFVLDLPISESSRLFDTVLGPRVFGAARLDLGDLRLIDEAGREVPYALRIRRQESRSEPIPAREFNRSGGPGGSSGLALDLGGAEVEHNEVEVELPGIGVRRRVRLDGSTDSKDWHELVTKDLFHFRLDGKELDDRRLSYPPSRFRYLRLRVDRDLELDKEPPAIGSVTVRRRVEAPGEAYTWAAGLRPREPVRTPEGPGSAWVLDLGGDKVPVERVTVEVSDAEFVRNYRIEAAGPAGSEEPFRQVGEGLWRRRAGEARKPLVAEFSEVTASRLKLVVIDHNNPPLHVKSVELTAPAREVVFAPPASGGGTLRLYVGNPKAAPPEYDFARNLPARLEPPPIRLTLGPVRQNPVYRPEPRPLTERWPWLIYVVLGSISLVLGGIILALARTTIALHDARRPAVVDQTPAGQV